MIETCYKPWCGVDDKLCVDCHQVSRCYAISRITRRHLLRWPLYHQTHQTQVTSLKSGVFIGYRTAANGFRGDPSGSTHFDVNVIGPMFFLLHIEVVKYNRGRGMGEKLYGVLTSIAAELQCSEIRQTPSGKTHTGESRMDYLLRRGWSRDGNEVFKSLAGIPVDN